LPSTSKELLGGQDPFAELQQAIGVLAHRAAHRISACRATVLVVIRSLDPSDDARACDAIVAGLPDWFGDATGIAECAAAVRTHGGLAAVDAIDLGVVGFLTCERRSAAAFEITWMAVRADRRGSGIGTELVERLAADLTASCRLLVVKTLSDRIDPGPAYAATRAFYLARGFRPMAELDIWGPENPCQLLGRRLS
jgi:GNAT superfamily N-acetyltransferase